MEEAHQTPVGDGAFPHAVGHHPESTFAPVLFGDQQQVGNESGSGVDIDVMQSKYPDMRFIGHFDKMTMPEGEDAMRAEFERLLPAARRGGFLISVDHQTPPSVSLEQYETYLKLFREFAERVSLA